MSTVVSPGAAETEEEYVSTMSFAEPSCGNAETVALIHALMVTEAPLVMVKVFVADSPAYRVTSNELGETDRGSATVKLT